MSDIPTNENIEKAPENDIQRPPLRLAAQKAAQRIKEPSFCRYNINSCNRVFSLHGSGHTRY